MQNTIDPAKAEDQRQSLIDFLDRAGTSEQSVTGVLKGYLLDNAFGDSYMSSEFVLTLRRGEGVNEETVKVNLADLLALATYQYRGDFGGVQIIDCDDESLSRNQQAALLNSDMPYCPSCDSNEVLLTMDETPTELFAFANMHCNNCGHNFRIDFAPVGVHSHIHSVNEKELYSETVPPSSFATPAAKS